MHLNDTNIFYTFVAILVIASVIFTLRELYRRKLVKQRAKALCFLRDHITVITVGMAYGSLEFSDMEKRIRKHRFTEEELGITLSNLIEACIEAQTPWVIQCKSRLESIGIKRIGVDPDGKTMFEPYNQQANPYIREFFNEYRIAAERLQALLTRRNEMYSIDEFEGKVQIC